MLRQSHKPRRPGFTLAELLVTIGVIILVLSLTLPVLKHARDRAIIARSLSGHRNISSMIAAYGIDRDGRYPFPYVKREGAYAHPIYSVSDSKSNGYEPAPMRLQARIWSSLLVRSNPALLELVYQGDWAPIVGLDVPNGLIGGSFVATSTMFADPGFFGIDVNDASPSQLRPTRTTQVVYPSSKMMFEDLGTWGRIPSSDKVYRSATFGFADGSAQAMSQADFTGDWVQRATAWQTGPGHTTLDGLAGRDR